MRKHVYDRGRCRFCGVNYYDEGIHGDTECVEREPIVYTTESHA